MKDRGVIYCATTTTAYLEAALISAIALRQLEPTLPITLISEQPLLNRLPLDAYQITPRFLERHEIRVGPYASRFVKTRLQRLTPYRESLFLDADILPLQPIAGLWEFLSQDDLAMALDRLPLVGLCDHVDVEEKKYTLRTLSRDLSHFNSGVILWRGTPKTQLLFQAWHEEWKKFQKQDQMALARAIHQTQISVTKLPRRYNISPIDSGLYSLDGLDDWPKNQPLLLDNQSNSISLSSFVFEGRGDVHLLHCWGGTIASGKFTEIAKYFYPNIVEVVRDILKNAELRANSQSKA